MFGKFLGAALAASLLCASAALAQPQDCSLKQIASLPITTTADGKIAVPVKVAGRDVLMAIELGTGVTGINAHVIDALKLDTAPIPGADVPANLEDVFMMPAAAQFIYQDDVFTRGVKTTIMRKVILPEFQIGALDVKDYTVRALPAWSDADGVMGILGSSMLSHVDVELDFANAKMNLYSQDHCIGKVVYWANQYAAVPLAVNGITGEVMAQASLDGTTLMATLSTDPGHGEISLSVAHKLMDISTASPDLKTITSPHPVSEGSWYSYPFKTFSLGGLALQNPSIDVYSMADYCTQAKLHGPIYVPASRDSAGLCVSDVIIRLAELKKLHLYFAFGEKRLYVTAADGHK
jgi:hypothetical protein